MINNTHNIIVFLDTIHELPKTRLISKVGI